MLHDDEGSKDKDDDDDDDTYDSHVIRSAVVVLGCDVISVVLVSNDGVIVCVDNVTDDVIDFCVEVTVVCVLADESVSKTNNNNNNVL